VLLAALLSLAAFAAAAEQPSKESLVSLDLKDTDVRQAIDALFRGRNLNYSISQDVEGTIPSLAISNVPFETALNSLLKTAGLTSRSENSVIMIAVARPWSNKVTVNFKDMPLRDAVTLLSKKANAPDLGVASDVPNVKVTYAATDVPLIRAVRAIATQSGAALVGSLVRIPGPWEQAVDVELKDASLGSAVDAVMKGAKLDYSIDPDAVEISVASLACKRVTRRTALDSLLKSTGTQMQMENGVAKIVLGPVWTKKVALNVKDMKFQDVLRELFKQAGVPNWKIDPNMPNTETTGTTSNAEVEFITMLSGLMKPMAGKFGYGFVAAGDPWQRVISMDIKDAPLSEAIGTLLNGLGISYTVDPAVQQLKVTAVLKNVTLDAGFKQMLKAAGAVYRVDGGVYAIGPKPAGPSEHISDAGGGGDAAFAPAAPPTAQRDGSVTRIVELRYVSAADVVPLLANGKLSVQSTSSNKLIISGSEQSVADAIATIQAVDDEGALARTIRLKMTAKVTVQTAKGPKTYEASTESVGAEQTASLLNLESRAPYRTSYSTLTKEGKAIKQESLNFTHTKMVDATLVPTIGPDGRVGLAGRGHFSFRFGPEPGTELSKDFDIAASAAPGKPVVVAAGSATLDVGKAEFTVSVTATPELGRVHYAPPPSSANSGLQGAPGGYGNFGNAESNYGRSYGQTTSTGGYRGW